MAKITIACVKAKTIFEKCTIQRCYDCDYIEKSETDKQIYEYLYGMDSANPTYSPQELYDKILAEQANKTKTDTKDTSTKDTSKTITKDTSKTKAKTDTKDTSTKDTSKTKAKTDTTSLNAYILYFTFIVIIFLIIYFILNRMNII